MLILGIDTATPQVGVALGDNDGVLASIEIARGRRHAELLTPAIDFACRHAGVTLDEVGCVAVDLGPGLFTGMRVGIAAAKAFALGLRIPIIGISSLDLLAYARRYTDRIIVPVIDARKGEVFWAVYRTVPGGVQQIAGPTVGPVDELVSELMARGEHALCVGDGADRYRADIEAGCRQAEVAPPLYPSPAALVHLAHARTMREEWVSPHEIEPIYLRAPDAAINWTTRPGGA